MALSVGLDVAGSNLLAALSLGVVAIGYTLGPWILAKYLSQLPGIGVVTCSLVLCAVIYAPIAAFSLPSRPLSFSVVASMATLTVICSAVAFVAFFALIGEVGAMRSNVVTYVNPAVAVLLGVSILGERFNAGIAVGFVLILSGSFLATRPLRSGANVASTKGSSRSFSESSGRRPAVSPRAKTVRLRRARGAGRSPRHARRRAPSVVTAMRSRANSLWLSPSTTRQAFPSEKTGNPKMSPSGRRTPVGHDGQ